ncbi:SDR family oxidoreductase [Streptomyces phyllanthi]|uniref:SDR family oxidoreductase n=1 Tax=Streptomyces phyllanthi TaxID=1803180 RepID=A0A5N8W867_9ACTN|nr:SDR family oxidoreductase [Streptomyces phyllanthi]MPY43660.1 SDR family oxidoreductase [Streptomyces phyllanthi]
MDLELAGRWAIIGASSAGLGLACAKALHAEGVNVVINGRNPETLESASAQLRCVGDSTAIVVAVPGDIASADTRNRLLDACPSPDILVTNNGGPPPGPFQKSVRADWERGLHANLLAHVELINRVVGGMCDRRFGRIVNITSAMVTTPRPTMAVSSAARAALTAAVKGLSLDVARFNVTINNLLPERFDTERQRYMAEVATVRDGITHEEARARQVRSIVAGRLGDPREFGATCAFLCSPLSGYLSGQNIHLDGGSYPALI